MCDLPEQDRGWQRPSTMTAPSPWEGHLLSNTTDLMTGSSGLPEESSAVPGLPGNVPDSAGSGGTSPESAGTVRSWPDADAHAGEARGSPKAQPTGTSRRGGAGRSAMLPPELRRLTPSVGGLGTGP